MDTINLGRLVLGQSSSGRCESSQRPIELSSALINAIQSYTYQYDSLVDGAASMLLFDDGLELVMTDNDVCTLIDTESVITVNRQDIGCHYHHRTVKHIVIRWTIPPSATGKQIEFGYSSSIVASITKYDNQHRTVRGTHTFMYDDTHLIIMYDWNDLATNIIGRSALAGWQPSVVMERLGRWFIRLYILQEREM